MRPLILDKLPPHVEVWGELPDSLDDAFSLIEDLLQITLPMGKVIDVGWYPECQIKNGGFLCRVVRNENWEEPQVKYWAYTISDVEVWLEKVLKPYVLEQTS